MASIALYKQCFLSLFKMVLPLLAISQALDQLSYKVQGFAIFVMQAGWMLFGTLASIKALQVMFRSGEIQPSGLPKISIRAFFFFSVLTAYVNTIGFSFALLFVIPGILLLASAVIAPVLVLENNTGPFEAIGDSVGYSKGNVLRISQLFYPFGSLMG